MRKSIVATSAVAILSVVALSACEFSFGKKSGEGSEANASGDTSGTSSTSDTSGSAGTGSTAKPEDQGAGGGDTAGQDASSPTGGQSAGTGGGDMQEVGTIIEGFTGQLDGYLDNYQQGLAAGFGSSGVRDVITGLQAGNEYRWNVGTLRGGQTYRILGACDQDCTDVDIVVEDGNGVEVGRDVALDDHPVVTITPRTDGPFSVRIGLVNCTVEPCYVAGRVVQQGQ